MNNVMGIISRKFSSFFEKNTQRIFVAFLISTTLFLRFFQLGYSHFYGDETKTLYWDKTIPAREFLLNQRKGPMQFIVTWAVETVTGGFDEFAIRLPFAISGALSVFVFYLILERWFNKRVAYIGAFLFSVNGFFVAFSRTAQYQSLLWLFGFLAILFSDYAVSDFDGSILSKLKFLGNKGKKSFSVSLSGLFLGFAFLTHYDALFFCVPVFYCLSRKLIGDLREKDFYKNVLYFMTTFLIVTIPFYLPYVLEGYFESNVINYLLKRADPLRPIPSSLEIYRIYNPNLWNILILGFAPLFLFSKYRLKAVVLDLWFIMPVLLFEFVFLNSGTHIQQYVIPIIGMTAIGIDLVIEKLWKKRTRFLLGVVLAVLFWEITATSLKVYIPAFNSGYPWKESKIGNLEHGIFLYGFPYNRGWEKIAEYLRERGAHTYYTSDNVTIGEHYLRGTFSDMFEPEYYVEVFDNQEFRTKPTYNVKEVYGKNSALRIIKKSVFGKYKYEVVKDIYVKNKKTAQIYRRVD